MSSQHVLRRATPIFGCLLAIALWALARSATTVDARPELQIVRGEEVYFASCAECHNSDLSGGSAHDAPALAGQGFMLRWSGRTAEDLLERTRTTMPQDQPRSLSDQAYVDVTAFVLHFNRIRMDRTLDEQSAGELLLR